MKKYGIPTADYATFDDPAKVMEYIKAEGKYPVVIKADGLALGKGVLICENEEQAAEGVKEIMLDKKFGASGNHVVVEDVYKRQEHARVLPDQDRFGPRYAASADRCKV